MTEVTVKCPAKVNVFLRIIAREATGYHQIETFYQALDLHDRITLRRAAPGIQVETATASRADPRLGDIASEIGPPAQNTVARAARAFFAATGIAPAVALSLSKAIPAGTGLGGGSSDAAATLLALNALHGRPLDQRQLLAIGGRIGSDVAFFCAGAASALAWGRGDRLLPFRPPPRVPVVVVIPRERVSTAAAYREVSSKLALPAPSARLSLSKSARWSSLAALAREQRNDFEDTIFARLPFLRDAQAILANFGAALAGLTGSGSAVFGAFPAADASPAREAAQRIAGVEGVATAFLASTLTEMPAPKPAF